MMKLKRLPPFALLSAAFVFVTIVAVGVYYFFGDSILERLRRQRFDPVAWKSDTHSLTNAVRIRMVDDLLQRHRFLGMTRNQVTGIIGEPDRTEYFSEWDMVYWLGPERGFVSIDSEWLVFRIDEQKKIIDYRVVRD